MRPIKTLLIANRGEIARRVMRTARAMGISTVAVFSDADDGAPHMREADQAVRLAGSAAADTYLRGDLIIAAARATGADAIHPGYGFLSENATFSADCAAAGIVFVGPSPKAIEAMGSKVGAKELMAAAGVPVLPGYTVGTDASEADLAAAAGEIGYPLLVKASFGGGGRGMRVVRRAEELSNGVSEAQREAAAAFGDGTVFLERYLDSPRHIEVQIFGDTQGNVISLFERECSIQRRHQKIIEEAPSPVIAASQRASLSAWAVAAGRSLGYVGAGTVEFVMGADGRFAFLEVNTRLQVEHPVTECITGLDLVRLQLEVAQGQPLPPSALDASIKGHAIEARLYAEDVPAGFVPVSGAIHRLDVPLDGGVRFDSGYEAGSTVSTFYDAMLGKVIAWAPTRAEAAGVLAEALTHAEIHGVVTNRELLVATLCHPEFLAGQTDTGFLERNDAAELGVPSSDPLLRHVHALAAALAPCPEFRSPQPSRIPRAWRNVGVSTTTTEFTVGDEHFAVVVERSRAGVRAAVAGGDFVDVGVVEATPELVEIELLGVRHRVRLQSVGGQVFLDSAGGSSTFRVVERFPLPDAHAAPGSLVSPMPGTVVSVNAVTGDQVTKGQTLVALEAMKMEHAIRAPHDGTVSEVCVKVGDQVETEQVLVIVADGAAGGAAADGVAVAGGG